MTYSSGGLIQATDYNGFVNDTAGANINATWGTASTSGGYGQSNLATVSAGGTVTATQWATLVNTLSALGSHTGTTLTSRTAPTAGQTITALAAVNTDIAACYTNRNNAASIGSQYTSWTGTTSKTTDTGSGSSSWTITFTHTVTFGSTANLYSFFNAGGYLKIQFGKSSTGTVADTEWNSFVGANGAGAVVAGAIVLTGAAGAKTINGTSYTGTTKIGGTGTPATLATSTGVYALTGTPVTLYKQLDTTATYTGNYVQVNASISGAVITLTTTWFSDGGAGPGSTDVITGGTATSGATFGTAPTTLVTYFQPESTYITNTWGTPTISATVS